MKNEEISKKGEEEKKRKEIMNKRQIGLSTLRN